MRMRTLLPLTVLALFALAARAGAQLLPLPPSPPGAAIQLFPCFQTDEQRSGVIKGIRKSLRDPVTNAAPDVRSSCSADFWLNGTETLGVWLSPLPANLPWNRVMRLLLDDARRRGLAAVDVIDQDFGWVVTPAFIETLRARLWEAMPKRLNEDGQPSRHGSIHLEGLTVDLIEPNRVRTRITGFHDVGPNTDFTLRILDTISEEDGKLQVETDTDLDVDAGGWEWLVGLTTFLLPGFQFPLAAVLNDYMSAVRAPDAGQSLGSMLVQFAPDQVMIEGVQKANFLHTRFAVSVKHGVSGGGTMSLVDRQPSVAIEGPLEPVSFERTIWLDYEAVTFDLRATADEPLQYEWFLDGDLVPGGAEAPILFEIPRNVRPGGVVEYEVGVRVTDADDLTAERTVTVRLRYEREQRPSICYRRPWLPQCGGPGVDR